MYSEDNLSESTGHKYLNFSNIVFLDDVAKREYICRWRNVLILSKENYIHTNNHAYM